MASEDNQALAPPVPDDPESVQPVPLLELSDHVIARILFELSLPDMARFACTCRKAKAVRVNNLHHHRLPLVAQKAVLSARAFF